MRLEWYKNKSFQFIHIFRDKVAKSRVYAALELDANETVVAVYHFWPIRLAPDKIDKRKKIFFYVVHWLLSYRCDSILSSQAVFFDFINLSFI